MFRKLKQITKESKYMGSEYKRSIMRIRWNELKMAVLNGNIRTKLNWIENYSLSNRFISRRTLHLIKHLQQYTGGIIF